MVMIRKIFIAAMLGLVGVTWIWVMVAAERIGVFPAEVRLDAADGEVHPSVLTAPQLGQRRCVD